MQKKTVLGLTFAAAGVAAYYWRRPIIARYLGLASPPHSVAVERGLSVPMRDGIALAADRYYPEGANDRTFPTILVRTPYNRRLLVPFYAQRLAERGYNVLVQDVRGRSGSEGVFEPFVHEADDGKDTVAWLEQQPWFDGRLGAWGQSYLGYVQWALALSVPDAVQAIMPSIASSRGVNTAIEAGAPMLDLSLRWLYILRALDNPWNWWRLFSPTQDEVVNRASNNLPLAESDRLVSGRTVPFFQQGLQEVFPKRLEATDYGSRLEKVQAAVHLVGGWYDFMLGDLLRDYQTLRAAGRQPYLTVGPWFHLERGRGRTSLREGIAWFDAHLKGNKARLRQAPVRLYLLGDGTWREFDQWPPPATIARYYLSGDEDGRLLPQPPQESPPDHYVYDPADPTPAHGGPLFSAAAGPRDNRPLEARSDVLTYTTLPLEKDVEIAGPVCLELFAQSSLEYADFFARLCDVSPDGTSINRCEGIFRVEPGKGERQEDGSLRVEVDMWATAARFRRGHRIRLLLSSGAHPHYARNLGTGAPPSTATAMRSARQTIFHDLAHPSALVLPVL